MGVLLIFCLSHPTYIGFCQHLKVDFVLVTINPNRREFRISIVAREAGSQYIVYIPFVKPLWH